MSEKNNEIIQIEEFIQKAEYTKKCYFWNVSGNSASRKRQSDKLSSFLKLSIVLYRKVKNSILEYDFYIESYLSISMSSKNVYRTIDCMINDISTNIMSLKSILAYLKNEKALSNAFIRKFCQNQIF